MSNPHNSAPVQTLTADPEALPISTPISTPTTTNVVFPSLPALVTPPGEPAPRSAGRGTDGFLEALRDSPLDSIPERDYARLLAAMPNRAKITAASAALAEWTPALVGAASALRQEIGAPRAQIERDLETARRELAEANAKEAELSRRLQAIDTRTTKLHRASEEIKATAEDLAKTYDGAVIFFDAEAEMIAREDSLIDQLAQIPEELRIPEEPGEPGRQTPAQQLARQIRLISQTLKRTQLGLDHDSDQSRLSTDYRSMVSSRFRRPFSDCPRRWTLFGAIRREFVRATQGGSIPSGRYESDGGQIEKLERALFAKITALYAAFPALDPSRPDAEEPVLYRYTAGVLRTVGIPGGGIKTVQAEFLLPSEAARINRDHEMSRSDHKLDRVGNVVARNTVPRLTPEADIPAAPPIPIPAKRARQ
jgi:hypothetical protein